MFLFTRSLRLRPSSTRDALSWAMEVTEAVDHTTDLKVSLWSRTFSPQLGTLVWSTAVEDLVQLEAADDKLVADEAYQALVARGTQFVEQLPDDFIASYVNAVPDPAIPVEYVSVVTGVCAAGALAKGAELGVRIAEESTRISGAPCSFLIGASGHFGAVAWVSGHPNLSEMQRAEQAVFADSDFLALVDSETPGVYADGVGAVEQHYYRKIM